MVRARHVENESNERASLLDSRNAVADNTHDATRTRMARVVARMATAAVGTSVGVAYAIRSRRTSLERDGYPPVTHPACPDYLIADADLLAQRLTASPTSGSFSGLWLAWYNGPLVLEINDGGGLSSSSLVARHLTGTIAVPAGIDAFQVDFNAPAKQIHGDHTGSLLPYGLWLSKAACQLNVYHTDLTRKELDHSSLSVDIFVLDWLPPVRVPLRRIPQGSYIERTEKGHVPRQSSGLEAAQTAVAQAHFEDRALD